MKGVAPWNENARGQAGVFETADTTSAFSFPHPSTVKGRVLGDLLAGRTITHKDTWIEHGSSRLAHHVYALRRDGWPIDMVEREVPTSDSGRTAAVGFYNLPQDAIHQAGERGRRYAAAVAAAKAEVRRGR